jgi:hypothetical protein
MSSYNTLTGRHGKISQAAASLDETPPATTTEIARVTNWGVNPTLASDSQWGDSSCGGYTARAAGRRDATFTTEGKYDKTTEVWDLFLPEDILAITLWLDHDARSGGVNRYWDFPRALCNDFNMVVDVDTEEVIGWTATWGADGIFYKPGTTANPGGIGPSPTAQSSSIFAP